MTDLANRARYDSDGADRSHYVQRVNRAIDTILGNLDQPLQLDVVARAAGSSPFHFHRIFRGLIGETLNQCVKRVRLERALSMRSRERSITEVETRHRLERLPPGENPDGFDVGLEVEHVVPEGEVGRYEFPAMQVAELELRGPIDLEVRALDWLFTTWLPTSGFVPTDQPSFEAWLGRPFEHGEEHFELRVQVPVWPG